MPRVLGPYTGVYSPTYHVTGWSNGNPKAMLRSDKVNWQSITAIQTSKMVSDIAGTFTITLKDRRARSTVAEMDVLRIRLQGHGGAVQTVFRGLVDEVRQGGSGDAYAGSEDTVITGRCMGKYLQVCSLFLPVFDPSSDLPTVLIFGLGDVTQKVGNVKTIGSNSPRAIYGYLLRNYVFGKRNVVGVGGIPNSRYWLDYKSRFVSNVGFQVPFLQFDEDDLGTALKRLEILGFTEAWVDELGAIVYRAPAWDAPASYTLNTAEMKNWSFSKSDLDMKTYVEVIPGGSPGIDTSLAQALLAGRAPVPSSYISAPESTIGQFTDPEFVIDTDDQGLVTASGRQNPWYRRQRKYGVRPDQVVSPLIVNQAQAQAQAQGLLRFYSRHQKTGSVTLPGSPEIKIGTTLRVHGLLDDLRTDRTYYIEGVQHEYVEGSHYDTTLTLTHGRDPWDPDWSRITLPKGDPTDLGTTPGILDPTSGGLSGTGGAKEMIAWAKTKVGTTENPVGSNAGPGIDEWSAIFGLRAVQWCATFLGYGLKKVCGLPVSSGFAAVKNIPGYAKTQTSGMQQTVALGFIQPGDLIIYGTKHVALYLGTTRAISGNYSQAVKEHDMYEPGAITAIVRPAYP